MTGDEELVTCPDGRVRRKIWHLFALDPLRFDAVCGQVFAGACLLECFTEDWMRVSCPKCLEQMQKGLTT